MRQKQLEVLDLLSDDHFALWDFEASFPSMGPRGGWADVALLAELVMDGHVGLFLGDLLELEGQPIEAAQAPALLRQPTTWQPTDKRTGYFLTLKEKGLEVLRAKGLGHP